MLVTNLIFASSILAYSGEATYYGSAASDPAPYGTGACENYPPDSNNFVAIGASVYSKSLCGSCALVTYQGAQVFAFIADMCPSCGSGIDLSMALFAQLVGGTHMANQLGRIPVQYEIVPCSSGTRQSFAGGQAAAPPSADSPAADNSWASPSPSSSPERWLEKHQEAQLIGSLPSPQFASDTEPQAAVDDAVELRTMVLSVTVSTLTATATDTTSIMSSVTAIANPEDLGSNSDDFQFSPLANSSASVTLFTALLLALAM